MNAPSSQEMRRTLPSLAGSGVVVRELDPDERRSHISIDANFKPDYKTSNIFTISHIPEGQHLARSHGDSTRWRPKLQDIRALPYTMEVREQSSFVSRAALSYLGALSLRRLALHFYDSNGKQLMIEKSGNCGAVCGDPWQMVMRKGDATVGRVAEDFDDYCGSFLRSYLCCITGTKVMELTPQGEIHRFTTRAPMCCCGRVDNCASRCSFVCCCPDDFILDVLSPEGELVSTIVSPFANGSCMGTYCSPEFQKFRYPVAMEFPKDATASQRELLLTALIYHKIELFANKGNGAIYGHASDTAGAFT